MSNDLTCIRTFIHRYEADFARSRLEAHGIPCMVGGDDQGGTSPHLLTGSGGARLVVRAEDADAALDFLDADPISESELEKYAADPAYGEGGE